MSDNSIGAVYPSVYKRETAIVAMSRHEYECLVHSVAIGLMLILENLPGDWNSILSTSWGVTAQLEDTLFNPVRAHELLQAQARLLESAYVESIKDKAPMEESDLQLITIVLRRFANWEREFVSWSRENDFVIIPDSGALWAKM